MELSKEQIKELVKQRPRRKELDRAKKHQQRLKFHSQTTLSKWDFSQAYWDFRSWIASEQPELLPADKATRILQLIRPPISTIELTESVYSKLGKVFHSNNAFRDYQFSNPELLSDWEQYRDKAFWPVHGFKAMQTAIDAVWVVDFPEQQKGDRPEPFNRLIDICDVIDIQNDHDNNCLWLIYDADDSYVVYDQQSIRIFEAKNGEPGAEIYNFAHGLGYTPARMFWSEPLDGLINKQSPVTKSLTDLDWLLLHNAAKRYMDLANAYPREIMYDSDDDYEDEDRTEDKDRTQAGKRPPGNKLMGPGTIIRTPPPQDSADADLMKNPFMLVSPDVTTLEWHVSEEQRLANKIYRSVVGIDQDLKNEQAKNEKQVDSAFESQLSVLLRVKKNFEIIEKFADSTMCRLRYGVNFKGCTIDYGTEFFLQSLSELYDDYRMAKDAGNTSVLGELTSNILDAKFRQNQHARLRAEIIRDLDPLPEKTDQEVIEIYKNGGVDKKSFLIRMNLNNFVRRFERDNISLVDFGANIDYSKKIDLILTEFENYAREQGQELQPPGE